VLRCPIPVDAIEDLEIRIVARSTSPTVLELRLRNAGDGAHSVTVDGTTDVVVPLNKGELELDSIDEACRDLRLELRRLGGAGTIELDGAEVRAVAGLDCDDGDSSLGVRWPSDYRIDADGDGFGGAPLQTCIAAGTTVVDRDGDCDENDELVNPNAAPRSFTRNNDSFDWNCDGLITRTVQTTATACVVSASGLSCDASTTAVTTDCGATGTVQTCIFDEAQVSCTLSPATSFTQTCR